MTKANRKEFLIFSKGRDHILKKEREFRKRLASRMRTKLRWKRLSTDHELHVISPPNFEELLGKDPYAVSFCHTKAASSLVPLGRCDGGQSMLSYLVWVNATIKEENNRSRGWRLHLTQGHEPSSSPIIPPARDLRLHLIDKNLNFKEVLG
ncbi:unnamed protein product [Linum trigynum]|uniref:Uncharacterized protein n=1 Tax=Linum trigynum TaxID=586398 RepID=A0AAV2E5I6_9ROSI